MTEADAYAFCQVACDDDPNYEGCINKCMEELRELNENTKPSDTLIEFITRIHDHFMFNEPYYYYYLDKCINNFICGTKLSGILNDEYLRWLFLRKLNHVVEEIKKWLIKYYNL